MKWRLLALTVFVALGVLAFLKADEIDAVFNDTLINAGFAVNHVQIDGAHQTDIAAIREVAGVDTGRHIFDQELSLIRARVEGLPWVESAAISRNLPGELHIEVREYRPFAIWQHDGHLRLIDRAGHAFIETRADAFPELPLIVGVGAPQGADALASMLSATPELAKRVAAAIRVGERRWDLKFDNGVVLSLPEEGQDQAWRRFAALQASAQILEQGYARLDLRLPDMLVVRPEKDSHKQKKALNVGQQT